MSKRGRYCDTFLFLSSLEYLEVVVFPKSEYSFCYFQFPLHTLRLTNDYHVPLRQVLLNLHQLSYAKGFVL